MGSFTNGTFLIALKGMWIECIIIFLCAYFISAHVAKYFAFRVVQLFIAGTAARLILQKDLSFFLILQEVIIILDTNSDMKKV